MFLRRFLSAWITISFVATLITPPQRAYAQNILNLPTPGTMVSLSSTYTPILIKGLKINPNNPLNLDFIVATGDYPLASPNGADPAFKKESQKLINYFFAALTLPEKDVWVNLSPYEKDRIVPKATGETEMGRDMLAQDYILKQLTASLIYPEKALGKDFWNKVYSEASERFGSTQIPVNTFNKVWIVADKDSVYEANDTVIVVDSHLKVMLDEDYQALEKHKNTMSFPKASVGNPNTTHSLGSQIIRQIILPALEKEVNEGKNFANLRQIFHSIILAKWYKETLKTALLNQVYSNRNKVAGLSYEKVSSSNKSKVSSPNVFVGDPSYIYQQYLQAYKKGVFNYIKEDIDKVSQQPIPRKYFSGGVEAAMKVNEVTEPQAERSWRSLNWGKLFRFGVAANPKTALAASIQPITAEHSILANVDWQSTLSKILKLADQQSGGHPVLLLSLVGMVWILNIGITVKLISIKNSLIRWERFARGVSEFYKYTNGNQTIFRYLFEGRAFIGITEIAETMETMGHELIPKYVADDEIRPENAAGIFEKLATQMPLKFKPGIPVSWQFRYYVRKAAKAVMRSKENKAQMVKPREGIVFHSADTARFDLPKGRGVITFTLAGFAGNGEETRIIVSPLLRRITIQQYRDEGRKYPSTFEIMAIRKNKQISLNGHAPLIVLINKDGVFVRSTAENSREITLSSVNPFSINKAMNASLQRTAIARPLQVSPDAFPGGIDLNASKINMKRLGSGMDIRFNPAMMAQFRRGNFDGIDPEITGITPIASFYPLIGLKEPADNRKLAVA